MIRTMAHHTSGDAKPLIPVQENASSGAATSVAPRFKRSSEANTHTTLKPSCSHGFPKPDGRFCIRFSSARSKHRNRFRITVNCSHRPGRFGHCSGKETAHGAVAKGRLSKLVRVWESLQDGIVPRRPEVFDHPAKDRIQQRIGVHDVQIERDQFAVQMQLRFIIERVAVVAF